MDRAAPPPVEDEGPQAADAVAPHEHRWSGVEFYLEDDRPWFRMRCACGAERSIRAWERYSDPGLGTSEPVSDEPALAPDT